MMNWIANLCEYCGRWLLQWYLSLSCQLWQIVCQSDDGSATLHDVDVETYAECSRGPGFCSGRPVSSLYVKGHYVFYTCYIVNMADFLPQPYAVLVFLLFVLPFCIGIGVSIAVRICDKRANAMNSPSEECMSRLSAKLGTMHVKLAKVKNRIDNLKMKMAS